MGSPGRSAIEQPPGEPVSCLRCQAACAPTSSATIHLHPVSGCPVHIVNSYGASSDGLYELVGDEIYLREPDPELLTDYQLFTPVDIAIFDVFDKAGLLRLGGTSGTEGWSSVSEYQRCPYSWARSHVPGFKPPAHQGMPVEEAYGKAVGSVVHTLLAVYYQRKITPSYPLSPKLFFEALRARSIDIRVLQEAWRLYTAHAIYYRQETIKPLWPERLFISPTSRRSCRVDLGVLELNGDYGHPAGLWLMDHKTAQRFDDTTLTGWYNDGGTIQQADIFQECWEQDPELQKLGPLQGVIISLIGRQKDPDFHRVYVRPDEFQVKDHRQEVVYWQAQRNLALATGHFPRARSGCITRYGKCPHWDHCLTGEG